MFAGSWVRSTEEHPSTANLQLARITFSVITMQIFYDVICQLIVYLMRDTHWIGGDPIVGLYAVLTNQIG